jgi:hypothetical protein
LILEEGKKILVLQNRRGQLFNQRLQLNSTSKLFQQRLFLQSRRQGGY